MKDEIRRNQIEGLEKSLDYWYIAYQGTEDFRDYITDRIHINQHYYKELTGHNYPVPTELLKYAE